MKVDRTRDLEELLGTDFTVKAGTYYEVFGPNGHMTAYYDHELDHILGHARVFFSDCEDHSESFLLELGRRAVEQRLAQIEERGFELTDEDSVVYKDSMGRDCPYYSVGIRSDVDSVEDAAESIKRLYDEPLNFNIDVGV